MALYTAVSVSKKRIKPRRYNFSQNCDDNVEKTPLTHTNTHVIVIEYPPGSFCTPRGRFMDSIEVVPVFLYLAMDVSLLMTGFKVYKQI